MYDNGAGYNFFLKVEDCRNEYVPAYIATKDPDDPMRWLAISLPTISEIFDFLCQKEIMEAVYYEVARGDAHGSWKQSNGFLSMDPGEIASRIITHTSRAGTLTLDQDNIMFIRDFQWMPVPGFIINEENYDGYFMTLRLFLHSSLKDELNDIPMPKFKIEDKGYYHEHDKKWYERLIPQYEKEFLDLHRWEIEIRTGSPITDAEYEDSNFKKITKFEDMRIILPFTDITKEWKDMPWRHMEEEDA